MGISSVEFSKIYEDDTKRDFQLEITLNKTFTEEGYALSEDCEVKSALQETESHSWPSCWMMVCLHISFVCTNLNLLMIVRGQLFFPSYSELTFSCVVPCNLW